MAPGRESSVWGWGLEKPGPTSIRMASEGLLFTASTDASSLSRRVPQLPQTVNSAGNEVWQLGHCLFSKGDVGICLRGLGLPVLG